MNRESLNILLKKAYYQQLSEEERKTLKLWLGESGENTEMYKRLMSGQSLTEYSDWVTGFDLSRAMEAIRSKVKRNRQRRIRKSVSWVAACVILCLGITFVFYFTSMDSEQVLTEQMAAQIQPGSAKAMAANSPSTWSGVSSSPTHGIPPFGAKNKTRRQGNAPSYEFR